MTFQQYQQHKMVRVWHMKPLANDSKKEMNLF
jgi:hypothetical protein